MRNLKLFLILTLSIFLFTACSQQEPEIDISDIPDALTLTIFDKRFVTATSIADAERLTASDLTTEEVFATVTAEFPTGPLDNMDSPNSVATLPPPIITILEDGNDESTEIPELSATPKATIAPMITIQPVIDVSPVPKLSAPQATVSTPVPESNYKPVEFIDYGKNNYRVQAVNPEGVLNIRLGPGVGHEKINGLQPNHPHVTITGGGEMVNSSLWVPIDANGISGWVNSRYLTPILSPSDFCAETQPALLVESAVQVLSSNSSSSMKMFFSLTHPARGFSVFMSSANSVTNFRAPFVSGLMSDTTEHNFGYHNGDDLPLRGTFANVVASKLTNLISSDTQTACHQMLSGDSSTLTLPSSLPNLNYYAIHNPASDWSTWLVGMEEFQGVFYITHLIYYQ